MSLDDDKYLTFEVSGQAYGLTTKRVREVVPHAPVSPVPDVPPFLLGVTNLRHEVIPVVDLQLLFGDEEPTDIDSRTCFIIGMFQSEDGVMAPISMVAHRVHSAYRLPPDTIDAAPEVCGRPQVHYVTGLGKADDGVKILLDLDRLMAPLDKAITTAIAAAKQRAEDTQPA